MMYFSGELKKLRKIQLLDSGILVCSYSNNGIRPKFDFFEETNFVDSNTSLTPVYKHHNITIRLTIQYKAALTTCKHK